MSHIESRSVIMHARRSNHPNMLRGHGWVGGRSAAPSRSFRHGTLLGSPYADIRWCVGNAVQPNRPNQGHDSAADFMFFITTKVSPHAEAVLVELNKLAVNVRVLSDDPDTEDPMWFPRRIEELDHFSDRVKSLGDELESDHPGATDAVYIKRRYSACTVLHGTARYCTVLRGARSPRSTVHDPCLAPCNPSRPPARPPARPPCRSRAIICGSNANRCTHPMHIFNLNLQAILCRHCHQVQARREDPESGLHRGRCQLCPTPPSACRV